MAAAAATTTIASSLNSRDLNHIKTHLSESISPHPKKPVFLKASPLKTGFKTSKVPVLVPVVGAQSSTDYSPDVKFYKVEAIIRPWRVPHVSSGLLTIGIRGATVSDVRGFGAQGGSTERHGGSEFSEDKFVTKVKMEIVVSEDQVEAVIDKIIEKARTGEIGDGKIFVIPVSDVIRVRTGERGEKAERMAGGRAISIDGVSDKNVMQLKKINIALFPTRHNAKYYADALASGEFTKLAYHGDICVGSIACRLEKKEGGGGAVRLYIMTLGVLAPYRGLGIGTKLLDHVLDQSAKQNISEIYLHVQDDAVAFYKKFGFEITETIQKRYMNNSAPDCYVLSKVIAQSNTKK